jgi:hypothetical protein
MRSSAIFDRAGPSPLNSPTPWLAAHRLVMEESAKVNQILTGQSPAAGLPKAGAPAAPTPG